MLLLLIFMICDLMASFGNSVCENGDRNMLAHILYMAYALTVNLVEYLIYYLSL